MATTSLAAAPTNSDFYMNPQSGLSPPDGSIYGQPIGLQHPPRTPPSSNVSPTGGPSPHVNVRQLRQPRQPLYIPAALRPTGPSTRPTDIPPRPRAPDTPPTSNDSSFDNAKAHSASPIEVLGLPVDGKIGRQDSHVLRRALSRTVSEDLEEELGEVNGMPTTAHWKPDVSSPDCAVCHQTFTWYFRRHHCRRCGDVVCDAHARQRVPLDQNARLHPNGWESKACDPCVAEWKLVKRIRHSRTSSVAESQNSSQGTLVPALPIPTQAKPADEARVGSMARSEGGMVWSTF